MLPHEGKDGRVGNTITTVDKIKMYNIWIVVYE